MLLEVVDTSDLVPSLVLDICRRMALDNQEEDQDLLLFALAVSARGPDLAVVD